MLTNKCNEDFYNFWLYYEPNNTVLDDMPMSVFIKLPLSMRFGVYCDFFDESRIHISEWREYHSNCRWFEIYHFDAYSNKIEQTGYTFHKNETLKNAIKEANLIYNEKYKFEDE